MPLVDGLPEGKYAVLANGHRMHYIDQGQGEAVVFLHGSGSGASGHSNFKQNYGFLVENGFRSLVIDHIGYGYSDKPDDVEYHLDFFVECIFQTMDAAGIDSATIIGNSLGGAIAIKMALDQPSRVNRLLLMAPGGIENQPDYFTMPGMQIMKEVFSAGAPDSTRLEEFIRRGLVYKQDVVNEQLIKERWGISQQQNTQVINTMVVPNMEARLGEISCPVLAFWGMNENMMPETGILKLSKGCKNIRMVLVSECGHWVMAEHAAMFNRTTLDWLKNG